MRALVIEEPTVVGGRHTSQVDDRTLWFDFEGLAPQRPDPIPAAVGLLPWAMRNAKSLHINGAVDQDLLGNLEEYRDYWAMWRKDLFRAIPITAEEVIAVRSGPPSAVAAFSGGVDASHLMIANSLGRSGPLGHRSLPIVSAVLVHGFDVPVDDEPGLARAGERSRPLLDALDVPLTIVRTNWRDFCPNWEMSFAAGLASVLHHFSGTAGIGLMASDEQYDMEQLPWGSNGTSNPMLGGTAFRIRTVGAGVSRTDKCRLIAAHSEVLQNVRVCWKGSVKGENCGRCEKCVRTKLNFAAAGISHVPGLGGPLSAKEVMSVRVSNRVQLAYLEEVAQHPLPDHIAAALRRVIVLNTARLWKQASRRNLGRFRRRLITR